MNADDHWAGEYATLDNNDASTFYHRIVLPGIQLSTVRVVKAKDGVHKVTYRVSDAGAPVLGAKVSARGLKCSVPEGKYLSRRHQGAVRGEGDRARVRPSGGPQQAALTSQTCSKPTVPSTNSLDERDVSHQLAHDPSTTFVTAATRSGRLSTTFGPLSGRRGLRR